MDVLVELRHALVAIEAKVGKGKEDEAEKTRAGSGWKTR